MIEVKNLCKRYGAHHAVRDLSFNVAEGEIVGFLGPNGAGKTTTMNMLTGYLAASSGEVSIGGFNMLDEPEKCKKQIGYLPDTPPLYGDMRVDEYLDFVADIKRVKKADKPGMVARVKETVGMDDMGRRLIKNLSKGYRQRLGLAQAMIGDPKALILDEPTIGLDPKQIVEMREVIRRLGQTHTVLLSSHILPEVAAVCDRVVIINRGRIIASDTPQGLSKNHAQTNKIRVRIKGTQAAAEAALATAPVRILLDYKGIVESGTVDCDLSGADGEDIREMVFTCLSRDGLPILSMKSLDLTLEEIFLQMIQNTALDDAADDKAEAGEDTADEPAPSTHGKTDTAEAIDTKTTETEEKKGGEKLDADH